MELATSAHAQSGRSQFGSDVHLLNVTDLTVEFDTERGVVRALNSVGLSIGEGETLAIVGESGSGKTVTTQAIMGTIQTPPGYITAGRIEYRGRDLLAMSPRDRRRVRGRKIALITQDALTALTPTLRVGFQIGEMFRVHGGLGRREARERSIDVLHRVGIPSAKSRIDDYPHQFSGGMQQRVMIAMAIALEPELIVADEPTTALDVTVQAQVLEVLGDLTSRYGMALLIITHDLAMASEIADQVAVMYAGRIVESGTAQEVFSAPNHPYTKGLLESIPSPDHAKTLRAIPGHPPDLLALPPGCSFSPRCTMREEICETDRPLLIQGESGRASACHFSDRVHE